MQENKESFLDSKSLIAILFLIMSWFAWDYYMKRKYPKLSKKSVEKPRLETRKEETIAPKDKKTLKDIKKTHQEKTLFFKGEKMEILFSSKGFGIKKLTLKEYKNRNKQPVSFSSFKSPLFSTSFFQEGESPIPFDIEQKDNLFIGVFSSPEGLIKKTIEVDESRFILKNKIEFRPSKEEKTPGVSLVFSHIKAKEEAPTGFLKLFFLYGQDILKAFVSHDGNRSKRFTMEELYKMEETTFSKLYIAALGGKYFGAAFINRTSFLPSVIFEQDDREVQARVDYSFLHFKTQDVEYEVFLGPKSFKNLQSLKGEVQKWLDFGFFGWLARPLLLILNWFYSWCGNWGWSIVLLTFFVRLALLPINIKSYKSTEVMRRIQPQIKEIREKYKTDPKKMNLEVMALMKEQKANPFGSCLLPLFVQLPIFFALYRVLGESIELYQSPFLFWIQDLSLKDPYFVLPVLASLVLFVQQSLTPMSLPKEQARLLKAMPLLFSIFMLGLPSGLVLYIFVSGAFALVQQFFFVKFGSKYFKGGENVKIV